MRTMPALPLRHLLTTLAAATAAAQSPLLLPVPNPPAAAIAWDSSERTINPTVVRSTFVQVDTSVLADLRTDGTRPLTTFTIDVFGRRATVAIQGVSTMLNHRVLRGDADLGSADFSLTIAADGTTVASLDYGDRQFAIAPTGVAGVHVLQEIDPSRLGQNGVCGVDHTHAVAAPVTTTPSFAAGVNSDCNLTTIDLLICYTPLARQNAGGTAAIETVLVNAVAQANDAHRLSGAAVEFRLVHTHETNYTEVGTNADLAAFRSTTDGVMDEVHALRDTYGADLMHLVTDGPASFCGVGYLMTSLSPGFASSAFALTRRTCISNRTLSHECGHNLGCHHDIANAGTAIYPYAYGYRTPDNAWRTIMAYAPGTRINRWSSPAVNWQGQAMGTAGAADNVLTLTNTTTTAAAFRPTTTLRWCDLAGGIAGTAGVPVLAGQGTIDQTQPIELRIRDFAPNAVGLLVIGASAINVPIFGGTLVPAIDVTLPLVGTTTELVENCAWLATQLPGFQAWFQAAFLDLGAVQGFAASDAVLVTVP
jgi:hypothetical protein